MSESLAISSACVSLLVLLLLRVPIAAALLVSGLLGILLLPGGAELSSIAQSVPFTQTANFSWSIIPMFILMGALVSSTGMVTSLFALGARLTSRIPGGIGAAAIGACAGFAAVSGSSVATSATMAPIATKEMAARGYRAPFAAALVAAAGTLGVLIPPSVILVLYGIVAGEPIGTLLLAGIVPGIISAVVLMGTVVTLRVLRPRTVMTDAGLAGTHEVDARGTISDERPMNGIGAVVRLALLFGVVIGGIYSGLMTTTESAAAGAFVALLIAIVDHARRRGWRAGHDVGEAFKQAASQTGMLFLILIGSAVFTYFFLIAGAPTAVAEWILGLDLPPLGVVALILAALIPLGMFLEPFSIVLIVVPLAYPVVVTDLGFSGIWFGILMVKMVELSLITPPVGLNVFVSAGVLKGLVTTAQTFKAVGWFVVADLLLITLFLLFPDLVTAWLPTERH